MRLTVVSMLAASTVVTVPLVAAFGASAPVVDWTAVLTVAPSVESDPSFAPQGVVGHDGEVLVPVGDGIDRFDAEDGALLSSLAAPTGVFVADVAVDSAGAVFATGTLDDAGDPDIWVGRYDLAAGTLTWSDSFGEQLVEDPDFPDTEGVDRGSAIAVDDSGDIYVAGNLNRGHLSDVTVRKYDAFGPDPVFAWEDVYSPSAGDADFVNDLDVVSGGVYVVGEESAPVGSPLVRVLDPSDGDELALAHDSFGTGAIGRATGVDATDDAVYVTGRVRETPPTGAHLDAYVVKLDPVTLEPVWTDMVGTGEPDSQNEANDVIVDDTTVYVVGTSDDPSIDVPLDGLAGSGGFLRVLTDNGATATVDHTLALPPGQGLGFHADAVYLTGTDTSGDGTCAMVEGGNLVTGDCILARLLHPAINTPPVADAGGPYAVDEGATVTLDGTESFDPDGTIVSYDWSPAGQLDDATSATPTFTAIDDDVVEITLTVTDDDGATGTDTTTVTVTAEASTFDEFADAVDALDLPQGISNSLIRKIEAAQQQFLEGDVDDAIDTLQSLIDQVDALEGKKLTADEAQQIRSAAQALLATIADSDTEPATDLCPNIDGVQETLPVGYVLSEGECVEVQPVQPHVDCAQVMLDDSILVRFGYDNPNSFTVTSDMVTVNELDFGNGTPIDEFLSGHSEDHGHGFEVSYTVAESDPGPTWTIEIAGQQETATAPGPATIDQYPRCTLTAGSSG